MSCPFVSDLENASYLLTKFEHSGHVVPAKPSQVSESKAQWAVNFFGHKKSMTIFIGSLA